MPELDEAMWFTFRGKMHAVNMEKKSAVSYCGVMPVADIETMVLDSAAIPDGEVCRRCLVEVGTRSVSEEPLEHALGRGVVASADGPSPPPG